MRYALLILLALLASCTTQEPSTAPGLPTTDTAKAPVDGVSDGVQEPAAQAQHVRVTLRNWEIEPSTLELSAGQPYELEVTSESGTHGLSIPQLGIATAALAAGESEIVTLTPQEPGTYQGRCNVYCGPDHSSMRMTVVVT